MSKVYPVLGLMIVALASFGCNDSSAGPGMVSVAGTVMFDGQPLTEGRITFHAPDGKGRSFSGTIAEGKYKLEADPGAKTVEITAFRPVPGKFDTTSNPGFKEPINEMYIPKIYNSETTLKADVSTGSNDIPFDLKSK